LDCHLCNAPALLHLPHQNLLKIVVRIILFRLTAKYTLRQILSLSILKIAYFKRFVNHIIEFEYIFMTKNIFICSAYVEKVTYLLKL